MNKHQIKHGILIFMISISSVYAGKWSSNYHDIVVEYNEKVWTVAEEIDSEEDTLLGLYDKGDGSSFLLRVELVEEANEIPDEAVEEALAESLKQSDSKLKIEDKYFLKIAGKNFRVIDYTFNNRKYGYQRVRHAFITESKHVIILMMSWETVINSV